jgi:hypothetical protein
VEFDSFIAIDWSGAVRAYKGIAVAVCRRGRSAPSLVAPRGAYWTREEIAEWLKERLTAKQRLLIGFDFAFGFPYEDTGYLGGRAQGVDDIFALWELIEARSAGDSDFGCNRFVDDPQFAHLFWKAGPKPSGWIERKRRAEHACATATKTRPDTLYKLLHSKQVGKASITGMRVLNHLRTARGKSVAIWPFETPKTSAIVEIYPTMFRKLATRSVAKLRSVAGLNSALAAFDSRPFTVAKGVEISDHATDALISAAGLRRIAHSPAVWRRTELALPQVRREGWIFGV